MLTEILIPFARALKYDFYFNFLKEDVLKETRLVMIDTYITRSDSVRSVPINQIKVQFGKVRQTCLNISFQKPQCTEADKAFASCKSLSSSSKFKALTCL